MFRPRNLFVIAVVALFALAACSDDAGELSNQNDFNLGEADAGDDDADLDDDVGPDEDAGEEDTGQNDPLNDRNDGWPPVINDHNHSDPPGEPDCMETFGSAHACGGYARGQWENGEVCTDFDIEETLDQFGCDNADIRTFEYWVADGSGTLELTDDTYDRDLQLIIDADLFIPEPCLEIQGFELSCAEFEAAAQDFLDLTLNCEEGDVDPPEGPGCDCIADEELLDQSGSGVLTVDDNVLRLEGEGPYYYCADDGVLNMRTTSDQALPLTHSYTFAP